MNKRKGVLEELRNENDETFKRITIVMQRYYKIYDLDVGTNHSAIFDLLFISDSKLTYDEIALCSGVSISTLSRYIKQYNYLARKLLNSEKF